MLSRYINIEIIDDDKIKAGALCADFFKELFSRLPQDAFVIRVHNNWDHTKLVMSIHSYNFRKLDDGETVPVAKLTFNGRYSFDIEWPGDEYKLIADKVVESRGAVEQKIDTESAKVQQFVQMLQQATNENKSTSCNHEWYVTSRSSALKHCRKCMRVAENRVDDN